MCPATPECPSCDGRSAERLCNRVFVEEDRTVDVIFLPRECYAHEDHENGFDRASFRHPGLH